MAAGVLCWLPAKATPLSGTKSIGPTGDYASLTAALGDIQGQSLGGALVLELQTNYACSVETFPLTVPALNGSSAANTVTIRPQTGAVGFGFANSPGANFSVLASTNLTLPLPLWTNLGPAVENPAGSGQYQFTAPPPAFPQMYYRVSSP